MHLKNLSEISIDKNLSFTLTQKKPSIEFHLKSNWTPILINKIILTSHLGKKPFEWSQIIDMLTLQIDSKFKDVEYSQTIPLIMFVSLYQTQPVFELKLVIPEHNIYQKNKSKDCELKLTLKFTKKVDFKLDFSYESFS
jgi:hypothetical protein